MRAFLRRGAWAGFCVLGVALQIACGPHETGVPVKTPPPAKVESPRKEDGLTTITLTAEAVARLGIQKSQVEPKKVRRAREYPCELLVPPGRRAVVAAPFAGVIAPVEEYSASAPGAQVSKGQSLALFRPLLGPAERLHLAEARAEAEGQVESASARLAAAEAAWKRTEEMVKSETGSAKLLEEARAEREVAHAALKSSEARRDLLARESGGTEGGSAGVFPIVAPIDGILKSVAAHPGLAVAAGAVLFEIESTRVLWARVPVYAGDLPDLATAEAAVLRRVSGGAVAPEISAAPISAPPTADPAASTVDLYYEVANEKGDLRPGQRLVASLHSTREANSLVVPWAAVVHDASGGAWIYEDVGANTFRRRRVDVEAVVDATAILARGPEPGTAVVVEGASELFGTEFGLGK